MKERFEGADGKRRLIEALNAQKVCASDPSIGDNIAEVAQLIEVEKGTIIITEGAGDNDLYFILAGTFSIIVKGIVVANRSTGDCVGEMSAVDPSLPRSATVLADELSVVARISENQFVQIADHHPKLWHNIAKELAKRLLQRNNLVNKPNDKIRLFIISSLEALPIAREIQGLLAHDALIQVWTDGVFFASSYALEALEAVVDQSDFAIAIAQPDDTTTSRGTENKSVRDNVLFELGLFMGRLGRKRTILFQPASQELKLPSDLKGLTALSYPVGDTKDMPALLGAPCNEVRKLMQEMGVRK